MKIKQNIQDVGPRLRGIMIITVICIMAMTTTISSLAMSIDDSQYQNNNDMNRQKDILNKYEKNKHIVKSEDLLQVNHIQEKEVEEIQTIQSQTIQVTGLNLFTTEVIQQGQNGKVKNDLKVTYENNKIKKKELLKRTVIQEKTDTIVSTGIVQPGAYFIGKLTYYGGDCEGGSGISACGISLDPVYGVQGNCTAKLNYNGNSYYCLAADPSIPFGTIMKMTNHDFSFESVAYGIVVDRGGAIQNNHIDIFNGTEAGKYFSGGTSRNVRFEIVSVGNGKDFWK